MWTCICALHRIRNLVLSLFLKRSLRHILVIRRGSLGVTMVVRDDGAAAS